MVLQYFKILRFYAGKKVPSLSPGHMLPGKAGRYRSSVG